MFAPRTPNFSSNELTPATQPSHDGLCVARQPPSSATAQNTSRFCPLTSHLDILLSQEYPGDGPDRTFASVNFSSPTTYEAHRSSVGLRQRRTTERRTVEGTPSLFFQASSNSLICVPSATMGIVHGRNSDNIVVADYPMSTTENYIVPGTYRAVSEHAVHVTNQAVNDPRRLHTNNFIFDDVHNGTSSMNMQRSSDLIPPTHLPVPVPAFSNAYDAERGQAGGGETINSTETMVERSSLYSLAEPGCWRCNRCMYETKRERDIVRHCLSLHHGGRRMFVCPSCGKEYSRRDSLLRHSRKKGCGL